ncbi:hypothetical protein CIRMBP1266_00310 [Enterococcus cecorum]|nr:hypothetical protein CIRMBP1266_00310 [Enterococcus cecorum]
MKVVRLFEDNMFEHELQAIQALNLDLEMVVRPSQTPSEIIENAKDADIIITVYEPLTKEVLSQLPNLKLVVYRSIGFNSVDLAYVNERQLPVSHITQYCVDEVANYVVAAILSHNRRILDFNQSVKVDHKWDYELFPDMRRLSSLTVGLIGFGNIPRLVAQRLQVFGCKVMAYDPFVPAEVFANAGVTQVSLEEIFAHSDYISSHLPLNDSTKEMLNATLFNLCENQPVFINSSRGGVVNEKDLVAALQSGKLSYAILDVVHSEDPDLSKLSFMQMDNVVLTPHIAFYSQEAFIQGVQDNFKNIQAFLNGDLAHAEIVNLKQIQA